MQDGEDFDHRLSILDGNHHDNLNTKSRPSRTKPFAEFPYCKPGGSLGADAPFENMVNPFAKQMIVSFFERLWSRGFDTYMFTEQYRLAAGLANHRTVEDPFDIGQSKEGPCREGLGAEDLCAAQLQDELGDRPKRERKAPGRLFEDPEYQSVYQDGKRKRGQSTDGSDSNVSEDGSIYDSEFDDDAADSTENDSEISSDFDVTGRNDVSNLEVMEYENGEVMLHSRSQKQMREVFNRLSRKD